MNAADHRYGSAGAVIKSCLEKRRKITTLKLDPIHGLSAITFGIKYITREWGNFTQYFERKSVHLGHLLVNLEENCKRLRRLMRADHGTGPPDLGSRSAPAGLWPDEARGTSAGRHDPHSIPHRPILSLRCPSCRLRTSWRNLLAGSCDACSREVAS